VRSVGSCAQVLLPLRTPWRASIHVPTFAHAALAGAALAAGCAVTQKWRRVALPSCSIAPAGTLLAFAARWAVYEEAQVCGTADWGRVSGLGSNSRCLGRWLCT
jgi:hypothetical protein